MKCSPPRILLVGDLPERELVHLDPAGNRDSARTSPGRHLDNTRVERVRDLCEALLRLSAPDRPPCELVVLCEPRPGVWTDTQLDALRRIAPLARYVRLSGSLCEGQTRSGRPASGTWGVPWHQWPVSLARDLEASEQGQPSSWSLPLTATQDERALAKFVPHLEGSIGHIAICSASAAAAGALAAACRHAGHAVSQTTEWAESEGQRATALVWDTTARALANRVLVTRLRAQHGDAPIVALVGFPRAEDVAAARNSGVSVVLAKPLDTGDLLWHVERLATAAA
jgi:CheY-like chemotaxis protein